MMSELAVPGLRATVRQLKGSAVPSAELRLLPYARSPLGQKCAMSVLSHIVSDQAGELRSLIAQAGQKLLLIDESSDAAKPALQASVVDKELAGQFPGSQLRAGDARLAYNPYTYGGLPDKNHAVQHELWHILLNRISPGFAADLASLQSMFETRAPYFSEHFIEPYSHFFTRVAAMEARCADYAYADAVEELRQRAPVIDARLGKENAPIWSAAVFSGLLFSHVFNFELFPETNLRGNNLAGSNYDDIKKFMGGFMAEGQMQTTEAFARRILQGSLLPDGQDVSMSGHRQRVLANWSQFAKPFKPTLPSRAPTGTHGSSKP
jgi:hypothetical protein